MSTSIIIGEVPDEVREELAARAALCGRSLEEYLRDELIALARRPSAAVWMARVRARKDALRHAEPCPSDIADGSDASSSGSQPRASDWPLPVPRRDVG
jgi:hypothetical protein